jgi:DNA polymerase V
MTSSQQEEWFERIEVEELWGIGRKHAPKLNAMNIFTVSDLKRASIPSMLG